MNFYSIYFTVFVIIFTQNLIVCDLGPKGRCGKPPLPPKAINHLVSPERSRFEDKEKVLILCEKEEFPFERYELECKHNKWIGKRPRCGRHIDAQVNHLNIYDCESPPELLVFQPLIQSNDSQWGHPLPPNSYHTQRVGEGMQTSANGSNCYTFEVHFDRKVQIWFISVEIWTQKIDKNITLDLIPFVNKYRTCVVDNETRTIVPEGTIFKFIFICDLNNEEDYTKVEEDKTDNISLKVMTNQLGEVGLDVLNIGDLYKYSGRILRRDKPDCGQFEVENVGIDFLDLINIQYIRCNDSFIDVKQNNVSIQVGQSHDHNSNSLHQFVCTSKGIWSGEWPLCFPKTSCPKQDIYPATDSTVVIEEIANVYYINESEWFAINDTFVKYDCRYENSIFVGKNTIKCLKNGTWSNKKPYCIKVGGTGPSIGQSLSYSSQTIRKLDSLLILMIITLLLY